MIHFSASHTLDNDNVGSQQALKLSKKQSSFLQSLHSRFTDQMQCFFADAFGATSISLTSLNLMSSSPGTNPTPPSPNRLTFADQHQHSGFFDCSYGLVMLLLHRMLGGSADPSMGSRPLSEIEQQLWRNALEPLLAAYRKEWGNSFSSPLRFEPETGRRRQRTALPRRVRDTVSPWRGTAGGRATHIQLG